MLLLLSMILSACGTVREFMKPKEQKAAEQKAALEAAQQRETWKQELTESIMKDLFLFLAFCLFLLPACTIKPKVKLAAVSLADGTTKMVPLPDLGGSLLTKKQIEAVKFEDPSGYKISYLAIENDEAETANKIVDTYGTLGLAREATRALSAGYNGEAKLKGTKDPNTIPVDPNLPTNMVVPEGSMIAPR